MSFLWNWLNKALSYLGFENKSAKILLLGLENAGKTSLLGMLKEGKIQQHEPTLHASSEGLKLGGTQLTVFDIGGHDQARRVWNKYFLAADAIVFIIDVSDRETRHKSVFELEKLMADEIVAECPILILGNKKDKPNAAGEEEIMHHFRLHGKMTGKGKIPQNQLVSRPAELFMTCVPRGEGYGDAFRWLTQYI